MPFATSTRDVSHSLPADTRDRIRRSLRPLARFPFLGPEIGGRVPGLRFLVGPWRWMLLVYVYLEDESRDDVVAVEDGRSSAAATSAR